MNTPDEGMGFVGFTSGGDVPVGDIGEEFLIKGLLSSDFTIMAGGPGAGKTHLAVALAAALVNGDSDFLGMEITNPVQRVAFDLTDGPNADRQVMRRGRGLLNDDHLFQTRLMPAERSSLHWKWTAESMVDMGVGLYVLDNVTGAMHGNMNDSRDAKAFLSELRPIEQAGIPILLLAHTSKPGEGYGPSTVDAALGSRAFGARARANIFLTHSAKKGRTLRAVSRDAEEIQTPVRLDLRRNSPYWSVCEKPQPRPRKPEGESRQDRAQRFARTVVKDQPQVSSIRALVATYAKKDGWPSEKTLERDCRRVGLEHDGSKWMARNALTVAASVTHNGTER